MVDQIIFKKRVQKILGQGYQVEFLGDSIGLIASLSDHKAERIYSWLARVVRKEMMPLAVSSDKRYKDWLIRDLLVFRYGLSVNANTYRILVVKIKNSVYIEFHLGTHKYYDSARKDLGLMQ